MNVVTKNENVSLDAGPYVLFTNSVFALVQ